MTAYTVIDNRTVPPGVVVPRTYNACVDFIDRHLEQGRGERTALIDAGGEISYAGLAERVNRAGNLLRELGAGMETRVLMCVLDSVDFVALFWGAIKIGAVPIPINTLLTGADYDYMLRDSRAKLLLVSAELIDTFRPLLADQPFLQHTLVVGDAVDGAADEPNYAALLRAASPRLDPAPTSADDVMFWLYTSGSTGTPKGVLHLHRDLVYTAACYGLGVLDIGPDDRVFSAAKLFFAYGLGNAMTFPLYVGASAVLWAGRPTPDAVAGLLARHRPSLFFAVPTLYAAMLADPQVSSTSEGLGGRLRLCVSAGEPLPEDTARRWQQRYGLTPLDGIGSTEMLHIFLSNRPGELRFGTTGKPVPGYRLRLVDEHDRPVAPGEVGELLVNGPSAALCYWNQRDKSLNTFHGPWTRTGDKYSVDDDGYYRYCGRTDDMLKVSGQWVSPFDVEFALIEHDQVLEAAVVGEQDEHRLVKPKAFVVLADPAAASEQLAAELQAFVKQRLAPFKYPRWIEFVTELPKTATGKIQRFKLRR